MMKKAKNQIAKHTFEKRFVTLEIYGMLTTMSP